MIEFLRQPWAWYVSGPLIALVMVLLLWAGGTFGVSSSLRAICSAGGAGKSISFFNYDWKSQWWNLTFVLGIVLGGLIAHYLLGSAEGFAIAADTQAALTELGISSTDSYLPKDLFSWESLATPAGFITIVLGGFLVGFGTRWAGGCTSGHAITGLSNLQLPSLIAVIGFFAGGLAATHFLFPLVFG
jgi:uncharacterized membrane protein YedE/YeeE